MEKKFDIKEHIGTISGLVGSLAIIVGTGITIDSRYVHADEFKDKISEQEKLVRMIQRDQRINFAQSKLESIDDKIFYLEQKGKLTPQDNAILSRLKDQRRDAARHRTEVEK